MRHHQRRRRALIIGAVRRIRAFRVGLEYAAAAGGPRPGNDRGPIVAALSWAETHHGIHCSLPRSWRPAQSRAGTGSWPDLPLCCGCADAAGVPAQRCFGSAAAATGVTATAARAAAARSAACPASTIFPYWRQLEFPVRVQGCSAPGGLFPEGERRGPRGPLRWRGSIEPPDPSIAPSIERRRLSIPCILLVLRREVSPCPEPFEPSPSGSWARSAPRSRCDAPAGPRPQPWSADP